jgi:hypothetical protein
MNHTTLLASLARRIAHACLRTRRARAITIAAATSAVVATPFRARQSAASFGGEVASIPVQLASATADIDAAATVAKGRHLGFDTSMYPGDATMQTWRDSAPYEWVGYYLPAPCHKDDSWSGKRETLAGMGWGTAVIYVGQQTWGKSLAKKSTRKPSRNLTCGAELVNAARGTRDADDAIARTLAEGFPTGTVVFLDIEYMERVPQAMRDYYVAWTKRVIADGRLRPGFYAHTRNAALIYRDVRSVYDVAGITEEPPFWIASARDFSPEKSPDDVGHSFAAAWQGILDHSETNGGVRLPIDVSVASAPSPSEMYATSTD